MFVAIHYIKWNCGGILSSTPSTDTHTPLFPYFFLLLLPPALCLCCNVHIFPWRYYNRRSACWLARRLQSERPADYVRLRAETKPAQPLNFTAFGSYSRSSAHFQPGACRQTSERERGRVCRREKNNTFYDSCKLTAEHCFHLCGFLYVCAFYMYFFCVLPAAGLKETCIRTWTKAHQCFNSGRSNTAAGFLFDSLLFLPFSTLTTSQTGHDWYLASTQVNSFPCLR